MTTVRSFTVIPTLQDTLSELETVSKNMFWSWNAEFVELFKRIDSNLWAACEHNPIKLLGSISQAKLDALAENPGFVSQLQRVRDKLQAYLEKPTWYERVCTESTEPIIAYFCAEFGIHECLPIYAGGLGILAGDHLKSASDLGVPLVGIGLLYQKGYFRQYLNIEGWQQEKYTENDVFNMPMELVRKESGRALTISVEYPGRCVVARIWCVTIGRVKLYLLDTNVAANSPMDRLITSSLYGGDKELRIRQEIMLGIGGMKALSAIGIKPTVCHMNEGHAAFMALERIRELRSANNISFDEAVEATKTGNVFTIHTPVKAGLDEFRVELMDKYFASYFPNIGINRQRFLSLGRILPDDENETFKMPVLALKLSSFTNGVSKLHGEVSRGIWGSLWPGVPMKEVPLESVTNGIHIETWLSDEMNSLFERYLGPHWADEETIDKALWKTVDQIPDEEIWQIHKRCKEQLIVFTRNRLKAQMQRRGTYHTELNHAEEVLEPDALTIGFARRFADYKRGNLLLKDPQRLIKLLTNQDRPLQIIFAGKAHPKDTGGKDIIRQIVNFANQNEVKRRIVFLENYDTDIARYLVRGVDVWLNNPRRPMEASGTSGMKAAVNGVLNMSTADGWWCEGYVPEGGWLIGPDENHENGEYQDTVESQAIYEMLENEVIPLYYTRSADNLPRAWIRRVKNSIKWIAPRFNTHRMVAEYTRRFYNVADAKWRYMTAQDCSKAKKLTNWKYNIRQIWPDLAVKDVVMEVQNDNNDIEELNPKQPQLKVGSQLSVRTLVKLGRMIPQDVSVELYYGPIDTWENIQDGTPVKMNYQAAAEQEGEHWFTGKCPCNQTGQHGVAVRILPKHPDLINQYEMGLILWEKKS